MNNARIITVASVALCAMGLRAAVPGAATPTWWGVINNHLEARFQKDSGATTTYRAYVKYAGENEFSKLGDVARTSGTGGQIINLAVDGTRPATFRMCGVNADGEGPMSADLNFTATNAVLGTLIQVTLRFAFTCLLAPAMGIRGIAAACGIGWSVMLAVIVPYYFVLKRRSRQNA